MEAIMALAVEFPVLCRFSIAAAPLPLAGIVQDHLRRLKEYVALGLPQPIPTRPTRAAMTRRVVCLGVSHR